MFMNNKQKAVRMIILDEDTNAIIDDVLNQKLYKNASEYITHLLQQDIKHRG